MTITTTPPAPLALEAVEPTLAQTDSSLVQEINVLHQEILGARQTSLQNAITIGEFLLQLKLRKNHAEWLPFVCGNLPFCDRTASNYMRCAKNKTELLKRFDAQDQVLQKAPLSLRKPRLGKRPQVVEEPTSDMPHPSGETSPPTGISPATEVSMPTSSIQLEWKPPAPTDVPTVGEALTPSASATGSYIEARELSQWEEQAPMPIFDTTRSGTSRYPLITVDLHKVEPSKKLNLTPLMKAAESNCCIVARLHPAQLEWALQSTSLHFLCPALFAIVNSKPTTAGSPTDCETVIVLVKGHSAKRANLTSKVIPADNEPWYAAVLRRSRNWDSRQGLVALRGNTTCTPIASIRGALPPSPWSGRQCKPGPKSEKRFRFGTFRFLRDASAEGRERCQVCTGPITRQLRPKKRRFTEEMRLCAFPAGPSCARLDETGEEPGLWPHLPG